MYICWKTNAREQFPRENIPLERRRNSLNFRELDLFIAASNTRDVILLASFQRVPAQQKPQLIRLNLPPPILA